MDNHSEDLYTLYRHSVGNAIANRADKREQQSNTKIEMKDLVIRQK